MFQLSKVYRERQYLLLDKLIQLEKTGKLLGIESLSCNVLKEDLFV